MLSKAVAIIGCGGMSLVIARRLCVGRRLLLALTANVIGAFLPVAQFGTSLVCISSMAGHLALSLSPELERHLATAPREEPLAHQDLDIDGSSPESSFITGNDILVDGGIVSNLRWSSGETTEYGVVSFKRASKL